MIFFTKKSPKKGWFESSGIDVTCRFSHDDHLNLIALHSGRVHWGGGDKTVPKRLEGCSMDMLPHMVKE